MCGCNLECEKQAERIAELEGENKRLRARDAELVMMYEKAAMLWEAAITNKIKTEEELEDLKVRMADDACGEGVL